MFPWVKTRSRLWIILLALAVVSFSGIAVGVPREGAAQALAQMSIVRVPIGLSNEYSLNARPYQQSALFTDSERSVQYIVYVAEGRKAKVARRALPSGQFDQVVDITRWVGLCPVPGVSCSIGERIVRADSHNALSIAVDADGRVHVAGNTHSQWLVSARSGKDGDLSTWTATPGAGSHMSMSYVRFVQLPATVANGPRELAAFARQCGAGDGNLVMIPYDRVVGSWSSARRVVLGRNETQPGVPQVGNCAESNEPNSSAQNCPGDDPHASPYFNDVMVDDDRGTIHLSWVWRIGTGPEKQTLPSYAYSDDGGLSWKWRDEENLERQTEYVQFCGAGQTGPQGEVIENVARDNGLTPTSWALIDSQGRYHVTYSRNNANGEPRIVHAYRDHDGWHPPRELPLDPNGASGASVLEVDNKIFLLYNARPSTNSFEGPRAIRLLNITPGVDIGQPFDLVRLSQGSSVVDYDPAALAERGELSMLISPMSVPDQDFAAADREHFNATNWSNQAGYVVSIPTGMIEAVSNGSVSLPGIDVTASATSTVDVGVTSTVNLGPAQLVAPPAQGQVFVRMSLTGGDGQLDGNGISATVWLYDDWDGEAFIGELTFDGPSATKFTPWMPVPEGLHSRPGALTAHIRVEPEPGATTPTIDNWTLQLGTLCAPPGTSIFTTATCS
jgi:putative BNR repeat neuraminidase